MTTASAAKKPRTADFTVEFAAHDLYGSFEPVKVEDYGIMDELGGMTPDDIVAALPGILMQAGQQAASRHIDYEDFVFGQKNSDSDYSDAIDRFAESLVPVSFAFADGKDRIRYDVSGTYEDGKAWSGHVEAGSPEEATVLARWKMTEEAGSALTVDGMQDFSDDMSGCETDTPEPAPSGPGI